MVYSLGFKVRRCRRKSQSKNNFLYQSGLWDIFGNHPQVLREVYHPAATLKSVTRGLVSMAPRSRARGDRWHRYDATAAKLYAGIDRT